MIATDSSYGTDETDSNTIDPSCSNDETTSSSSSNMTDPFPGKDETVIDSILSLPIKAKIILSGLLLSFVFQILLGLQLLVHPW